MVTVRGRYETDRRRYTVMIEKFALFPVEVYEATVSVLLECSVIFSARQHIAYTNTCVLSALYVITRPSVCPSVCHTGGSYKDG